MYASSKEICLKYLVVYATHMHLKLNVINLKKIVELGIFIGYKTVSKAYEMFQPQIDIFFGK